MSCFQVNVPFMEKPPLYFHNIQYRHDSVFGHQALFDLNPYTILGIRHPPKGTQWDISLDYLSFRGFGGGTMFESANVEAELIKEEHRRSAGPVYPSNE